MMSNFSEFKKNTLYRSCVQFHINNYNYLTTLNTRTLLLSKSLIITKLRKTKNIC